MRKQRVNLSLDPGIVEIYRELAIQHGTTVSGLISLMALSLQAATTQLDGTRSINASAPRVRRPTPRDTAA